MRHQSEIESAAAIIAAADTLLIGAGAGMGVDSGLPDFRGSQGFWRAYPRYQALGLEFAAIANPRWFRDDPALAWGFYGHRFNLYRATRPHSGFSVLARWAERMSQGGFVFTSNVDGQFQEAGFSPERVVECHGTIRWMQCLNQCGVGIFEAPAVDLEIDETSMRAHSPLPACPRCHGLTRPNILMFGDGSWDERRTLEQEHRFERWKNQLRPGQAVIIECGAGTAIPSVRMTCEQFAREHQGTLIRINPREPEVPNGRHMGLPLGAAAALEAIDRLIA